MSRIGVIIGMTATKRKRQSARKSSASATNTVVRGGRPACTSAHTESGQPSTMESSSSPRPKRRHRNVSSLPQPLRQAKKLTVAIISSAMMAPGTIPPRNMPPTETLASIA